MPDEPRTASLSKRTILKAAVFLLFAIAATLILRMTSLKSIFSPEALDGFLTSTGLFAPVVFIIMYALSICLFVPASIMAAFGAFVFGTTLGTLYSWAGAVIGASGAFFMARTMGRRFIELIIGGRIKKYDDAIAKNGFITVFYLRLLNSPFTHMSFGFGLTKVRFKAFFFGTVLGVLVSIFIIAFIFGTLRHVWTSRQWEELISLKVCLAFSLYLFSFSIPKLINMIRKRNGR